MADGPVNCQWRYTTEEWETTCEAKVDHPGLHHGYAWDGEHVTILVTWDSEAGSHPLVGPRKPYRPHVHDDSCPLSCYAIQTYMPQLMDDVFGSKPLIWMVRREQ